eukprot:scaffold1041_cov124-Isochrysis_galbana.AAC.2
MSKTKTNIVVLRIIIVECFICETEAAAPCPLYRARGTATATAPPPLAGSALSEGSNVGAIQWPTRFANKMILRFGDAQLFDSEHPSSCSVNQAQ